MEEAGNHLFLGEPNLLRKVQYIDAVEFVVIALFEEISNSVDHRKIESMYQ